MRELLILLFTLIFGINSVFAYDLVLPKEKKSISNTEYAFFVGKAKPNEIMVINDEKIYIASNGAFAHSVKLKEGENRIIVKSNFNTQVYKIYKDKVEKSIEAEIIEYDPQLYRVKKDNTPLRKTPLDYGMNRISHLFKDTLVIVNGEKGDFYRVFLTKNKEAWISKANLEDASMISDAPKFITMNSKTFKNASVHTIEFTEKLPYTIEENEKEIVFKVYNPFISDDTTYTVNIKKPQKYTYKTILNNGVYVFKVSETPFCDTESLEGITITIDAGHGGSEKGAIGCLGDLEKDINLKIANELKNILCLMGANVILTRECDGYISLDERIKLAEENDSNIFVSIHLNSIGDVKMDIHKNKGTSVYYYNQNSKELAKILEESVSRALGTKKDGTKTASFAVIRPTDYIGVLVEVAYMTNPIDSLLYTKEDFPRETAKAIAEGIFDFLKRE
jgi:N-acetylmuramoyl-L-alanine amidase